MKRGRKSKAEMAALAKRPADLREPWQIEQAAQCGCKGTDDMCPCQNENPWPRLVVDWKARAEAAESALADLKASWPIATDGAHIPGEQRLWLARKLMDSKLTDKEAFGIVRHHPDIDAQASAVSAEMVEALKSPPLGLLCAVERAGTAAWGDTSSNHRRGHRILAAILAHAQREGEKYSIAGVRGAVEDADAKLRAALDTSSKGGG